MSWEGNGWYHVGILPEMVNKSNMFKVEQTKVRMKEKRGVRRWANRNPEYNRRDELFREACSKCARERRCSIPETLEGPEGVCNRLVETGIGSCEYCLRYKPSNPNTMPKCTFECCLFVPKEE